MITAIVEYTLPAPASRQTMCDRFKAAERKFRGLPGLERKYFCYSETTGSGLSVYVWPSRAAAEAFFTPDFVAGFEKSFGTPPRIRYFDTLMIIDNVDDRVTIPASG